VFHLVNGSLLDRLMEMLVAPVVTHLGMDHVLIDGGQLVGETGIQLLDDS
jgi:hypothetical protein